MHPTPATFCSPCALCIWALASLLCACACPQTIKDPEAKKPEEWDERAMIDDPEDKKPEG